MVASRASQYGVSFALLDRIINCESGYSVAVQSKHRYHAGNVPRGYRVGDTEQSFGLVQVHLPAHPNVSYAQAIDPEFATDFLAKNVAQGRASWWSCYTNPHVAMR